MRIYFCATAVSCSNRLIVFAQLTTHQQLALPGGLTKRTRFPLPESGISIIGANDTLQSVDFPGIRTSTSKLDLICRTLTLCENVVHYGDWPKPGEYNQHQSHWYIRHPLVYTISALAKSLALHARPVNESLHACDLQLRQDLQLEKNQNRLRGSPIRRSEFGFFSRGGTTPSASTTHEQDWRERNPGQKHLRGSSETDVD